MNTLRNPNQICPVRPVAGLLDVYVSRRSFFGRTWIFEEGAPLQYDTITGHLVGSVVSSTNPWYRLQPQIRAASFEVATVKGPSIAYDITLGLAFSQLDTQKRNTLEQLTVINDALFIAVDAKHNYWLLGETKGCQCTVNWQSGAFQGDSQFDLTAQCTDRQPPRVFSQEYIDTYLNPPPPEFCELTTAELCALTTDEICNDYTII